MAETDVELLSQVRLILQTVYLGNFVLPLGISNFPPRYVSTDRPNLTFPALKKAQKVHLSLPAESLHDISSSHDGWPSLTLQHFWWSNLQSLLMKNSPKHGLKSFTIALCYSYQHFCGTVPPVSDLNLGKTESIEATPFVRLPSPRRSLHDLWPLDTLEANFRPPFSVPLCDVIEKYKSLENELFHIIYPFLRL